MPQVSLCCICKNEENRLRQWFESAKEADHIVVVDTGSTDTSLSILDELSDLHPSFGVAVFAGEFRFDAARQASFDLAPDDSIKMWIDIDEVFDSGWADELRNLKSIPARINTIMNYGTLRYSQMKGGNRESKWRYRIHEVLESGAGPTYSTKFETHHNREQNKAYRSDYLHLLQDDYRDDPSLRTAFYLLREYTYRDDDYCQQVKDILHSMLAMSGWDQYMLFARIHAAKYLARFKDSACEAIIHQLALHESIEAKYEACKAAYDYGSYFLALHLGFKAISINTQTNLMFEYPKEAMQGSKQLIVDSLSKLGLYDKAIYYGTCYSIDISGLVGKIKSS